MRLRLTLEDFYTRSKASASSNTKVKLAATKQRWWVPSFLRLSAVGYLARWAAEGDGP